MSSVQVMQCVIGVLSRVPGEKGLQYCDELSALASTCWGLYEIAAGHRIAQAKALLTRLTIKPDFQGRYKPELAILKPLMNEDDYKDLDVLLSGVSRAEEDFFAWALLWLAVSMRTMPMNLLLTKDRFDDIICAIYPLFPEKKDNQAQQFYPDAQQAKDQIDKFVQRSNILRYITLLEGGNGAGYSEVESSLDWVFRTGRFASEYNDKVREHLRTIGKRQRLCTLEDLL